MSTGSIIFSINEGLSYLFVLVDKKIVGAQPENCQSSNNFPTCFRLVGTLSIVETETRVRGLSVWRWTGDLIVVGRFERIRRCSDTSDAIVTTVSFHKRSNGIIRSSIEKNFRSKCPSAHNSSRHF